MLIIVIFCSKFGLKEREETPTGMRSKLALAAVRFKAQSERERERRMCEKDETCVQCACVCVCVGMCVRARDKVLIHFLNEVECVCVSRKTEGMRERERVGVRVREDGNEIKFSGNHKNVGGPLGCIPFIITPVGDFKPV